MDIFVNPDIDSKIILDFPIRTSDEFYISVVRPIEYEDNEETKIGLSRIFDRGIVTHYVRPHSLIPRCSDIFAELASLKNYSVDKPHYMNAIDDIHQKLVGFMSETGLLNLLFILVS